MGMPPIGLGSFGSAPRRVKMEEELSDGNSIYLNLKEVNKEYREMLIDMSKPGGDITPQSDKWVG